MKVRCINNSGVPLTLGKEYEVVSESSRQAWNGIQTFWRVRNDSGNVGGYWQKRFAVVVDTHEQALLKAFGGAQ